MERRIIQIAVTDYHYLYAVCDDGTTWFCSYDSLWEKLPAIPQSESIAPSIEQNKELLADWAARRLKE